MNGLTMDAFRSGKFSKATSAFTAFMFTFVFYLSPNGKAVAQEIDQKPDPIVLQGTPEQKMNQGLLKLKKLSAQKKANIEKRLKTDAGDPESVLSNAIDKLNDFFSLGQLAPEDVSTLKQLSALLTEQHEQSLAGFAKMEADLLKKGLPDVILERHRETVAVYQQAYEDMHSKIQSVIRATDLETQKVAVDALHDTMSKHKLKKSHRKIDPSNLPWSTQDASKTRKPGETSIQLSRLTGIPNYPQGTLLAANVITPEMLGQPGGPVAEDLAETPDIKFTDEIRTKATELNENPVEIYNWVRNNIEFIPSYGSIQGAGYTFQHGKGNAFDTASLLISLLRASNIPARYAYGTVEVPVEKVMNWVGGVEVPEAAQQLLGQGGIPNVAIVQGGKITHIKMEHVWVEAWVDFLPSRGAKHHVGDSWIPIDASFKQYQYVEAYDVEKNVVTNPESFVSELASDSISDSVENSVQGISSSKVEAFLSDYQLQLENYVQNQGPAQTIDELVGAKRMIVKEFDQFSAGLPYHVLTRTHNSSVLPDQLRHKFRITLQNGSGGYLSSYFNDVLTYSASLPEIAGELISVSYIPATEADDDTLLSYYPDAGPDGTVTSQNLPTRLPGYLVNLKPELRIGEKVLTSSGQVTLGSEMNHKMELFAPNFGWSQTEATGVAGEYRAIGFDLAGISRTQLSSLKADLDAMKDLKTLTDGAKEINKHNMLGLMMQSNILGFFALNDVMDSIQSSSAGVVEFRLPSYGYFHTMLSPDYAYGIPVAVELSGMTMDVPYMRAQSTSTKNEPSAWMNYNRIKGFRASYLENWVPEQHFVQEEGGLGGVSAAKLIAIANEQGQKIFTITDDNIGQLSGITIDDDSRRDIVNAIRAGKEVTLHQEPIIYNGWKGSGYLIIDPETGAGGYLISGGKNGGGLVDDILAGVAFLLGWVDGRLEYLSKVEPVWFSENLKYLKSLAKSSAYAGVVALLAGIVNVVNSGATGWDLYGPIIINIVAFVSTMLLVAAVAAATGPFIGAILGAAIAAGIAQLASRITNAYV